jgi:PAS domain S-box-containing protein
MMQENTNQQKSEETVRASDKELSRLNRILETLYQCNHALVHATDEDELFQSVCEILVEVGGLRLAWVGCCEDDTEKTVRPVAKAGYGVDYLEKVTISWSEETEWGRGPTGIALRTGKPCWVKDTRTDPILAPWRTEATARNYASCVALPLIAHGKRLGSLSLYAREPNVFNESTIEQYSELANNLAYGVAALRTQEERRRAEEALRHSEQRLQDIVDNSTAVVFVKDLELRYVLVNREYERRHLVLRDQVRGKTDFDIHPRDVAEAVRANDCQVIEAGAPIQFEESVPSAQGERTYISSKFLLRDHTGKPYAVCGIATDITQLKQAEALQTKRARQAALRAEIRNAFSEETESGLQDLLQRSAEAVVHNFEAAFARIWTLNEQDNMLELQASAGQYTHLDGEHARIPVGKFKIGLMALERKPHLTNDVLNDPRISHPEWAQKERMRSFAGHPLVVEGRLLGVLGMFSRKTLEPDTVEALALVSDAIAQGIDRKVATEKIREHAVKLSRSNEVLRRSLDALAREPVFVRSASGRFC